MISDAEIAVSTLPRGLSHHFQRIYAIGPIGVRMQDAANICITDEPWQSFLLRYPNFTTAFA